MNYTEMLFNRDERLVNLLNQADSKNLELIEEINNREEEIERLKKELEIEQDISEGMLETIDKAIEYIEENEYSFIDKHGNSQDISQFLEILKKEENNESRSMERH